MKIATAVRGAGQSVWTDYLSRELVESDALTRDGNGSPAMTRML
jgi:hypothetical protein